MAGRKNRGLLRMIYRRANTEGRSPFEVIDAVLLGYPVVVKDPAKPKTRQPLIQLGKPWDPDWRLPRASRPRCGATTRKGSLCLRQALANGRCPNHGGLSTGPKTGAGKARIAETQRKRWEAYRNRKARLEQEPAE